MDYLSELSELADEEDKWITRVKDENQQWEIHPYGGFIEVVLKDFGGKTALGQQSPTLLRRE